MEKSIEVSGKTIEAAIESAVEQLGADRDRVSIEVLEKPKTGFLGLGGSQARVKATLAMTTADVAESYLVGLLDLMNASVRPIVSEDAEGRLSIELVGEGDLGMLIGRRGETLDAIQHLVNSAVNKTLESPVRVTVDVENYRKKRVESLERLAHKVASKVLKDRRNIMLEPMNAYERHVIHAALQDRDGIHTFSVGSDPNRQVVVAGERSQTIPPSRTTGYGRDTARGGRPPSRPTGGRRPYDRNNRPQNPAAPAADKPVSPIK